MELNLKRVWINVRQATTEDLLDRATVYRGEIEPDALEIIDAELVSRSVTLDQIQAHLSARGNILKRDDGTVVRCSFCHKPATLSGWGWHRMFGKLPIFPRRYAWCEEHRH